MLIPGTLSLEPGLPLHLLLQEEAKALWQDILHISGPPVNVLNFRVSNGLFTNT